VFPKTLNRITSRLVPNKHSLIYYNGYFSWQPRQNGTPSCHTNVSRFTFFPCYIQDHNWSLALEHEPNYLVLANAAFIGSDDTPEICFAFHENDKTFRDYISDLPPRIDLLISLPYVLPSVL